MACQWGLACALLLSASSPNLPQPSPELLLAAAGDTSSAAVRPKRACTAFMTMLAVWISAVLPSSSWKGRKLSARLPKAHADGLILSGNLQTLYCGYTAVQACRSHKLYTSMMPGKCCR